MVFLGWCMVPELNEFGSDNDSERHQIFNTKVANLDPSNFEDLSASQILISWVHLCQHLWSKALYLSSLSFRKLPIRMHLCQSYAFVPLILMWLHASANYLNTIDNCKHQALIQKTSASIERQLCVIKGWCWSLLTKTNKVSQLSNLTEHYQFVIKINIQTTRICLLCNQKTVYHNIQRVNG